MLGSSWMHTCRSTFWNFMAWIRKKATFLQSIWLDINNFTSQSSFFRICGGVLCFYPLQMVCTFSFFVLFLSRYVHYQLMNSKEVHCLNVQYQITITINFWQKFGLTLPNHNLARAFFVFYSTNECPKQSTYRPTRKTAETYRSHILGHVLQVKIFNWLSYSHALWEKNLYPTEL